MKLIKRVGYGFILGLMLALVGNINFMMWEFYAIVIPVIILAEWKAN